MFHIDVGENSGVTTQQFTVTESFVRSSLDQTLVGDSCAGVDVHTDELSVDRGGDGECRSGVIAQDVDP